MAKHAAPETEAPADTRRIPMTSPNGRRTRFVSPTEAQALQAKGWHREMRDLWS